MYFVIFGTDKPGTGQQRQDTLDDVVSYVRDRPGHPDVTVHCSGPTLDAGGTINGTLYVIEAPSLEAAQAFLADNPLQKMGLLEDASVRQLDWKTGRPD
ncbi:MAG: YciI family protein [Paracoccaceae bacterium]|nr:YciI family protein [Paracoccaceae bacterium]MDE2912986.1 YciI family protein [Paracoccaceae bacterium]